MPLSPPDFADFRERQGVFEQFAAGYTTDLVLTGGEPERVVGAYVSSGFFEALGLQPVVGRTFRQEDEILGAERMVMLSFAVWQRRFGGDADLVGRTANVSDRPHTVIGIAPRGFACPEETELWLPVHFEPAEMQQRASRYLKPAIARLKQGVSVQRAGAEMEVLA